MNTIEMPRYVCHKTVRALKVHTGPRHLTQEFVRLIPEDKRFGEFLVHESWCQKRNVKDVGYYVVYEDGYDSWSPVEAFEKGYTPIAEGVPDVNSEIKRDIGPVRASAKLAAESPWVTMVRRLAQSLESYDSLNPLLPEARTLLKDGVALGVDPLEQALINLAYARDGEGRGIVLYRGDNSSFSLRKAICDYGQPDFEGPFFYRDSVEKKRAMAAWYRNLALLANATAAAIDHE